MSLLPSTRIVRACASVPVEAFRLIVDRETRTADDGLAVPLAGDDAAAKEIVATLQMLANAVERVIDKASPPTAGSRTFQRLNRSEYENAIRDWLGAEINAADDLPLDTKSANLQDRGCPAAVAYPPRGIPQCGSNGEDGAEVTGGHPSPSRGQAKSDPDSGTRYRTRGPPSSPGDVVSRWSPLPSVFITNSSTSPPVAGFDARIDWK